MRQHLPAPGIFIEDRRFAAEAGFHSKEDDTAALNAAVHFDMRTRSLALSIAITAINAMTPDLDPIGRPIALRFAQHPFGIRKFDNSGSIQTVDADGFSFGWPLPLGAFLLPPAMDGRRARTKVNRNLSMTAWCLSLPPKEDNDLTAIGSFEFNRWHEALK